MAPGPWWAASPPLPGEGSREEERPWRPASLGKWPSLPGWWARLSGWAGGCRARWPAQHIRPGQSPSPFPGCSHFIRPLPGCSQRGGGPAGGRAGVLACRGRAYSSPHPQEVTSSHSLQGGVGARILGSGRRMESPELRGGASGGGGSGTAGGRGFQSPVGDEGLTASGFGWKDRRGRVGGAGTPWAAAGWGGRSCQQLGWQPPAPPRRQVAPGG